MKAFSQLTLVCVLFFLLGESSYAQTQKVHAVSIDLIGTQQNTNSLRVFGARITSGHIIQALRGTNGVFTPQAKLVAITEGDSTGIFIRDKIGNQVVYTDVSGNFSNSTLLSLTTTNKTLEVSIQTFSFGSDSLSFTVQGFTVQNIKFGSEISNVNGTGSLKGNPAALRGTIALTPGKIE